jgi:mandelate racemase
MNSSLTLKSVKVRAVVVPLRRPVIAGIGRFDQWPMILVDVETQDGITGHSYIAPYRAASVPAIAAALRGLGDTFRSRQTACAFRSVRRGDESPQCRRRHRHFDHRHFGS